VAKAARFAWLDASRKSPKLDDLLEIDLAAEFSRLSEEELRKAPYLELIVEQGMMPSGAMERRILLRIAEAIAKEKGDAAQVEAIQEKATQKLAKSEQYRADLASALENAGGVEFLTSPIEPR
jgi:hypothetical protein